MNRPPVKRLLPVVAVLAFAVAACGAVVEDLAGTSDDQPSASDAAGAGSESQTDTGIGSTIQEAAELIVAGDMTATFNGNVECRVEDDTLVYDVGRGAFTGRPGFVFSSGAPEEGHQMGLFITVLGFNGEPGTYDAGFELADFPGPYDEPVTRSFGTGTAQLEVAERGFDFVNAAGSIDGSYSGDLGAGQLTGSLGVCGYYTDVEVDDDTAVGMDAEIGLLEMRFTGDYEGDVIDGWVDAFCFVDEGTLEVVFYLDERWPFSLIMTVPGFDGPGTHSGTWEAGGYNDEFDLVSSGPVKIEVDVLHDDGYDEDWARIVFNGSFDGDVGSADSEGNFACSLGS